MPPLPRVARAVVATLTPLVCSLTPLVRAALTALPLALGACSSTPASPSLASRQPPPASALAGDWLDGGSTLQRAHFERLLDVASQDPEVRAFLERAAVALKRQGPGDLFGLLSVCNQGEQDEGGHTFLLFDIGVFSLDVDSLIAGKASPQVQAQLDEAARQPDLMRIERRDSPDYVLLRRSRVPRICLARGISVASAYEALVHELVHASQRDPQLVMVPASQSDQASFLVAFVQAPGDEVDAYLTGARATIRLDHGRRRVHRALQPLLDDQGQPVADRATVARTILAPVPNGLGYATGALRDAYAKELEAENAEHDARQRVVNETLAIRREQHRVFESNVGVHQHNIAAYQQNATIYRSQGDRAGEQKALAGVQEATRLLTDTQRQLAAVVASEQRLTAESALLGAKRP